MKAVFHGHVVFLTGASSGIGAALAREFSQQGASVSLVARREDRLRELQREIESRGGQAEVCVCDVTNRKSLDKAVETTVARFGKIDVAVANAGFGVTGLFERLTTDDFRRQFATNVFGVIDTIYAVLPFLKASRGRVAIVSSLMGRVGLPTGTPYGASKFALCGLAQCLYYELAECGVAVTCILPGLVESDIRRTDNRGVVHEDMPDPAPSWLVMPAERAAKIIVRGIYKKRPEVIVTHHAKLMILLSRHFPRTWRWMVRLATKRRMGVLERRRRGDLNRDA